MRGWDPSTCRLCSPACSRRCEQELGRGLATPLATNISGPPHQPCSFFDQISQDTGKYIFGVKDTLACLDMGAVETLIIWENLEVSRYVFNNSAGAFWCPFPRAGKGFGVGVGTLERWRLHVAGARLAA